MPKLRPRRLRGLIIALLIASLCYAVAYSLHTVLTWQFGIYMANHNYWFSWLPAMDGTLGFVIPSVLVGLIAYLVIIRPILLPPVEKWHCRHCGYALQGLSQSRCPECGQEFDPQDPKTLADSPHAYRQIWRRRQLFKLLKALSGIGLLVLIPAVYASWLAWQVSREQQIVRDIGATAVARDAGPAWLVNLKSKRLSPLLQRVYNLNFVEWQRDQASLARLKEFAYLREIYFQNTPITNDQLQHVKDLHDLQCLGLMRVPVDDEGLKYLEDLAALEYLDLAVPITGTGLVHLHKMQKLRILRLDETLVTDENLTHLKDLASLQLLSLKGTSFTGRTLGTLSNLLFLSHLDLRQTQLSDEGLAEVSRLKSLDTLVLLQTPITNAGLTHLENLPNLRILSLGGTGVSDEGLVSLKDMTSLKVLHVQRTQVNGSVFQHLGKLATCLQELDLSYTPFDDAGMTLLPQLPGLQTLHLERTKVTSAGLVHLQPLSVLGELYLDESQIDQTSLPVLKKAVKSPGQLVIVGKQDNPDPATQQLLDQLRTGSRFSVTYERESDPLGHW